MKVISMLVGAALLIAALLLSYQSAKGGESMQAGKDKIMAEYMAESDKALNGGDIDGAIKYAKKAIQFDPNSKVGYDAYEKLIETKYKPVVQTVVAVEAPVAVVEKTTEKTTKVVKTPTKVVEKPKKEVAAPVVEKVVPVPAPEPAAPKPKPSAEPMGC